MNDTNLQAYALSKGIDKSTQEMTSQEKIGLAMQMFLEKTADYAGNYAKENETLAGSLTTAKAALKNFLSGAGDAATLGDALVSSGNVIATKLTELLPHLVTGITTLLDKLIPHIPPLLEKVLPGVIEGAVVLVKGLVKALPSLVKNIITSLFKAFGSTLSEELGNSVEKALNSVLTAFGKILGAIMDVVDDLLPIVVDILDFVSEIIDTLFSNKRLGENLKKFLDSIVNLISKIVPVIMELAETALPIICDILNIILPILTVIADVLSWIFGFIGDMLGIGDAAADEIYAVEAAVYELSESEKKAAEQAEEARVAHEKLMDEFSESAQDIENERKRTEELWQELQNLCIADGKVKEGHIERAEYIVGELAAATGLEIELINGQIQKYDELTAAIDRAIQKKYAEALLTAREDSYFAAKSNVDALSEDRAAKFLTYQTDQTTYADAMARMWEFDHSGRSDGSATSIAEYKALQEYLDNAEAAYNASKAAYEAADKAMEEAVAEIAVFEEAQRAALSGQYDLAADLLLQNVQREWEIIALQGELSEAQREELEHDLNNAITQMRLYQEDLAAGVAGHSEAGLQVYKDTVATLQAILDGTYEPAVEAGKNMISGFQEGIEEGAPGLLYSAGMVARGALDAMKTTAEIRSPSRVTRGFGRYIMEGLALGIEDEADLAIKAAEEATSNALDAMTAEASSISMGFDPSNVPSVDHVISGAVDTKQDLRSLIESLPDLITYAISNGLSLNINNREFARMVKAVT